MSRPVWAEVDLQAMAHNVREIRRITRPEAAVMAIIKADGYGHGAVEAAQAALKNGAAWLGVALTQEGVKLRKEGFESPILILGYSPPDDAHDIVSHGLTQTVYRLEDARALSEVAKALGKTVKVHIKVDTGMGRLGFTPGENAVEEILAISRLPNLEAEGLFTHFAASDASDKAYTLQQLAKFLAVRDELKRRGVEIPILHTANSGAIIDLPETHLNLVRAGIILYGLYPSEEVDKGRIHLKPVMSLKARVSHVKAVEPDTPISYGCTYRTEKKTVIATVPIGYADGYTRLLSNKAHVLVHGRRAPVRGRVCMDQLMIDVGHIPGVQVGDEVVLFGRQGGESLPVEELANLLGTINYEIVCMVSPRVPRVYLNR